MPVAPLAAAVGAGVGLCWGEGGGSGFRAPPLAVAVGWGGAFCWWAGGEASAASVRA